MADDEAEIPITAELELVRDQFKQDVAQMRAEFEQTATEMESRDITIPVRANTQLLTSEVQTAIALLEAQEVIIPVRFVPEGSGGGSGGESGFFGDPGALMRRGSGYGGGPPDDVIDAEWSERPQRMLSGPSGAGDASYGGGAGSPPGGFDEGYGRDDNSGGGGGGSSSGGGLGRRLGQLFAFHQIARVAEQTIRNETAYSEQSEKYQESGNPEDFYRAEIQHRKSYDSMFFGVGRLGRFIQEEAAPLWGGETVTDLERGQRDAKDQERRDREGRQEAEQLGASRDRNSLASISDDRERELAARQIHEANELKKDLRPFETQRAEVRKYEQTEIARAKEDNEGPFRIGVSDEHVRIQEAENDAQERLVKIDARERAKREETTAAQRAQDDREDRKYTQGEGLRNAETISKLSDVEAASREAGQRAAGDSRGASDAEFTRHLDDEIAHYKQLADSVRGVHDAEAARYDALAKSAEEARPQLEAARKAEQQNADRIENAGYAAQRGDIIASAQEEEMRDAGQTRAAGDAAYQRRIDERIGQLREQATDLRKTANERAQATSTADTLQGEEPGMIAARSQQEDYQDRVSTWKNEESAYESHLHATGQLLAAEREQIRAHFDEMRTARSRNGQETGSVDRAEAAENEELARRHSQQVRSINDQADILNLQTAHQPEAARLRGIENEYRDAQDNAAGDPAKQEANRRLYLARLDSFLQPTMDAHQSSMVAIHDDLQARALEDVTGHLGRDAIDARAAGQRDRDAASRGPLSGGSNRGDMRDDAPHYPGAPAPDGGVDYNAGSHGQRRNDPNLWMHNKAAEDANAAVQADQKRNQQAYTDVFGPSAQKLSDAADVMKNAFDTAKVLLSPR